VTNTGASAISGYDLSWTLGADESFSSGWNASFSSVGNTVTASNVAGHWNGELSANGGTSSFGFQVSDSSAPVDIVTGFTLNGVACSSAP